MKFYAIKDNENNMLVTFFDNMHVSLSHLPPTLFRIKKMADLYMNRAYEDGNVSPDTGRYKIVRVTIEEYSR